MFGSKEIKWRIKELEDRLKCNSYINTGIENFYDYKKKQRIWMEEVEREIRKLKRSIKALDKKQKESSKSLEWRIRKLEEEK